MDAYIYIYIYIYNKFLEIIDDKAIALFSPKMRRSKAVFNIKLHYKRNI